MCAAILRGPLKTWIAVPLAVVAGGLWGCSDQPRAEYSKTSSSSRHEATVERVVDGDTVVLSGIGKARLIGIDTPEVYGRVECYGQEASTYAHRKLGGKRVTYSFDVERKDRYGRALIYLWLPNSQMFNELLVKDGYATPMTIPPNVKYAARFVALARQARKATRGLWSPSSC